MDGARNLPGARLGRRALLAGLTIAFAKGSAGGAAANAAGGSGNTLPTGAAANANSSGAPASTHAAGAPASTAERSAIVKARHLKKGDTVGICAPSSPLENETELEYTFQWLKKVGLKYKLGKHLFESYSDFAGDDEARLADFHAMWADSEVKAVMPLRGGNGAARLLPKIDFELIARNPKIIVGYSDITALLVAINQITGLVTFHGPMMGGFFEGPYTYHNYLKAVMSTKPLGLVVDQPRKEPWNPEGPPTRVVLSEGKAHGRITGGCMTLLKQMMGSPYEIETEGKIVFLEDLDAEPHEIDRFLTQLHLSGALGKAAGIVVGECTNCSPGDSKRNVFPLNFSLDRILKDRLGNLGIPVVYGLRFGHSKEKFTFPLGVQATLEAGADGVRLKIEESATI